MVRKTKEETMKTRKKLLDVALDVFHEFGYAKATLEEIAKRAGYTRGAVYWHFAHKSELFIALDNELESKAGFDNFFDQLNRIVTIEDFLLWVDSYLHFLETDKQYQKYHEIIYFRTEWSKEIEPVLEKSRIYTRCIEKRLITIMKTNKRYGDIDYRLVGITISSLLEGIVSRWFYNQKNFSIRKDAMLILKNYFMNTFDIRLKEGGN